jgi:hypothetical protein
MNFSICIAVREEVNVDSVFGYLNKVVGIGGIWK